MTKKNNTISDFPIETFNDNWTFSTKLALDLYFFSKLVPLHSLKQFFVFLKNVYDKVDSDDDNDGIVDSADDIDDIDDNIYYKYSDSFLYEQFFFEKDKLYFRNSKKEIYFVENIPHNTLMCVAIRVGLNAQLKDHLETKTTFLAWRDIFFLLIKKDFSIIKMIEKSFFSFNKKRFFYL